MEAYLLAKLMHNVYEAKAKKVGWKTQESCRVEFDDLPEENKNTMLAVAEAILKEYIRKDKATECVEINEDNLYAFLVDEFGFNHKNIDKCTFHKHWVGHLIEMMKLAPIMRIKE